MLLSATLCAAGTALPARAQNLLEQFSYDQLRPSGVEVDVGFINSNDLEQTAVGGVRLDFGRFAPRVRVLFGLSYFKSDFDDAAIARFAASLDSVVNPGTPDTIQLGEIAWADIVLDADLQYALSEGPRGAVFAGAGLSVHVRNGSGSAIDGTFVEDALDGVTAGLNGMVAGELTLRGPWRLTSELRGVVSSELSTFSARFGVMYRFTGGS